MLTKINIDATKINTQERKDKLERVAGEMHRIVNSTYFQDKILKMKKHGETSKWKDKSNLEIYSHIMSGSEVLNPEEDYQIDIWVDDYYTWKKVIGYTSRNTRYQYVNTRYFDKRSTKLIGSNVLHEYGHKLGFGHDFSRTKRRPFSICYQLNEIYEECYDRVINGVAKVDTYKVKVCHRPWWGLGLYKKCRWEDRYEPIG